MARNYLSGTLPSIQFSADATWLQAEITEDGNITINQSSLTDDPVILTGAEAVKFGDALSALGLRALAMKRGDI